MKNHTVPLIYALSQSEAMEQLGAKIALHCPKSCVMFLEGPLGVGKTTFARGFIQALTQATRVKSPTYTLLETYTVSNYHILHMDLYRLNDPWELENLGVRDYTDSPAIWLIEWPKQGLAKEGVNLLPEPDVWLNFAFIPNQHQLSVVATSVVGEKVVAALSQN